jgi:excisionase family DNA binding protein
MLDNEIANRDGVTGDAVRVSVAARRLGMSRQTLYNWVAQRRIGSLRFGRSVRIPASEIQRIVTEGFRPPVGTSGS